MYINSYDNTFIDSILVDVVTYLKLSVLERGMDLSEYHGVEFTTKDGTVIELKIRERPVNEHGR